MLLRSSSIPVAKSPFSDSPNRDFATTKHPQTQEHCTFIHSTHHHHLHLSSFSLNSSPISHYPSGFSEFYLKPKFCRPKSLRRAHSDSNLEGLASTSFDFEEFPSSEVLTGSLHKNNISMLRTEPSFSIYTSEDGFQEEDGKDGLEEREKMGKNDGCLERSLTIGDCIGSGKFSIEKKCMGLIKEENDEKEVGEEVTLNGFQIMGIDENGDPACPPMYLATGFEIDYYGVGGVDFTPSCIDEAGDVEEYYKSLVSEDPSNPLFLRNYAQLLQSKGDLTGAVEYYFRATMEDPKDGEILLQYAKLVWELHHDQDRALSYFERAVCAAPDDSHVLAAYASFLWEMDEDKDESFSHTNCIQIEDGRLVGLQNSDFEERPVSPPLHLAVGLGIDVAGFGGNISTVDYTATDIGEVGDIEEFYKRMVKENSCNPLFLRNYAQFLYQSKGDLQGADEYYLRAMQADPGDGKIISQYAKLVWELHHDQDKALCYFERAVQAAPADSHVLAAYAKFLWETDEGDEFNGPQYNGRQILQVPVMPANA